MRKTIVANTARFLLKAKDRMFDCLTRNSMHSIKIASEKADLLADIKSPLIPEIDKSSSSALLARPLGQNLKDMHGRFSIREILEILIKIAEGLKPFHQAGYALLNIDPSTVIYGEDIKIIRFDHMTPLGKQPARAFKTGFSAPEISMQKEADRTADIFSIGSLGFWLITGEYYSLSLPTDYPEDFSLLLKRIFKGCLAPDPNNRFQTLDMLISFLKGLMVELSPIVSTEVAAISTIGTNLDREKNEDCLCHMEQSGIADSRQLFRGLYAVVDGMGGVSGGQAAAQKAVSCFTRMFLQHTLDENRDESSRIEPKEMIAVANQEILDLGQGGAAASVAVVHGTELRIGHVGDTRIYLFRNGRRWKLTWDQSLPASLYASGQIDREEMRGHRKRNQLVNYLGRPDPQPDLILTLESLKRMAGAADEHAELPEINEDGLLIEDGDILLLCSDGLWDWWEDHMTEDQEEEYLRFLICDNKTMSLTEVGERLVSDALSKDGNDNISILLVRFSVTDRLCKLSRKGELLDDRR